MRWICLDIETADAPESAIQEAIEAWKAPCTWKAETVVAKRQEAADRYRDKAALLDASPIICIAVAASDGRRVIFNGMPTHMSSTGWHQISSPDEKPMLIEFRQWCDHMAPPDATLVGHNIRGFDLPKLRQAYVRHRLKLPELLRPRMDGEPPIITVDTMRLVCSFSMELRDEKFISLDRAAAVLGIEKPKQIITGADVPSLYRQGQYQVILTYCAIDTATTTRAYLLMTGQAPDLE